MDRSLPRLLTFASLGFAVFPASVAAQSSPSDYTSAIRYDDAGRATGTIAADPDGTGSLKFAATRTTFDSRGLPVKIEAGELSSWKSEDVDPAYWTGFSVFTTMETTYDTYRRKATERLKGSDNVTISLTQFSYDNRGRLECTALRMNPAVYDSLPASACTLGTEGPNGPDRITRTIYDDASQVLQVRKAVGTSIEIADVTYSYTPNGQIEDVIDANGNRAQLRYDGFGRQSRWVFPSKTTAGQLNEGDYEAYSYDANGNRLTLRKRDGTTIAYAYDALNRMTKKDLPYRADLGLFNRRDVYYAYDLRGLRTEARFWDLNGNGVATAYDGFGRMVSEEQIHNGTSWTITSQYDANGNRTRLTYPNGQVFDYGYDGLNRHVSLVNNGAQEGVFSYNASGLLEARDWTRWTLSDNRSSFGYDNAGRLSSLAIDVHNTARDVSWSFSHNPASQILIETQDNDAYAWDRHANFTRDYAINGLNQYTSAGSDDLCYDSNGNLTADGDVSAGTGFVYLYDIENRLVEMRGRGSGNADCDALNYNGAVEVTLYYDPLGRLFQVYNGSLGMQRLIYDGDALIAEYNSSNQITRMYAHGTSGNADDPLLWFESKSPGSNSWDMRRLHADPRGSIVAVSSYNGHSIAVNTYDEYGIPDSSTGGSNFDRKGRFRYTGQLWIPELGMYYYKARIYSPTLGRFLQTDPIGYEDQFNLYAYVGNDPINAVDPSGEVLDTIVDVGFIVYDVGALVYDEVANDGENRAENLTALGADVVAAVVPGVTGAGLAVRGANKTRQASKTCCFVAGTLVDTETGLRPIEDVVVGDRVWARDEITGETALKEVTDLIRRHERVIWQVELTGPGGEVQSFETTDDHPWWIGGQGWKTTEQLESGMAVVTRDGRGMLVTSVRATDRRDATYNLTVADFETYFVGENRVLVHNCPPGTYKVPGDRTGSKKEYIGQNSGDTPADRSGNGRDGRVRQAGDRTTEMPGSTRREREIQEQREMNAAGGVKNLDNKRNSVSPKKWKELGIDPPK